MPQYIMVKDKIELGSVNPDFMMDKIASKFCNATINRNDGLKLLLENSWVHIRKSNTEPIIRIYAEASTEVAVKILIDKVKSTL